MNWEIEQADAIEALKKLDENSVDALCTDPPAGINFMSRTWDHDHGGREGWVKAFAAIFSECLRVMKPGAHGFVWALPRTSHWTATALEDAGFEIRDVITHHFGSGYPKSLDVSKAIDGREDYLIQSNVRRAAVSAVEEAGLVLPCNSRWDWTKGEHAPGDKWWEEFRKWLPTLSDDDRERVEGKIVAEIIKTAGWFTSGDIYEIRESVTEEARQWHGWGTALKPATEHWILVRKPLSEKNVSANVLKWGTGGINVDGGRVELAGDYKCGANGRPSQTGLGDNYDSSTANQHSEVGRFPPNLALTHSEGCTEKRCEPWCPIEEMDRQSGECGQAGSVTGLEPSKPATNVYGEYGRRAFEKRGDSGGASRFFPRFFYTAKASRAEREEGLGHLPKREVRPSGSQFGEMTMFNGENGDEDWKAKNPSNPARNFHPTVKPVSLMRWLIKLICPPGGLVLDPFAGSGTTGVACVRDGYEFYGIERDPEYTEIARSRIAYNVRVGRQESLF